ncbi:peptidoglycan DD-metalloendopeptidase family protein [Herpetosiphon geysericola]|uniref:peptidoglycan DD-metalloendopeptidase family protein n=1 Tax=Herpetosiphon geysericola TaxID=70996 RepID=UPI0006C92856|nr:peptidoglycan DD-metalloendopeptidase family protein [Herpetosiphon geysericola]
MARRSLLPHRRLQRAWRFDRGLPKPLIVLLLLDLCLVLPVPFLLPTVFGERPVAQTAPQTHPETPLATPFAHGAGIGSAGEQRQLPLLIDAVRLQDARYGDAQTVASLIANYLPALADQRFAIGNGMEQAAANIITGQALRWNINPLVVVSLLTINHALTNPLAFDTAFGGPEAGFPQQVLWVTLSLREGLSQPLTNSFQLNDGTWWSTEQPLDLANASLLRVLTKMHNRKQLEGLLGSGNAAWVAQVTPIMGDPRQPIYNPVADQPFMFTPFNAANHPIAQFDHQYPLIKADGTMLSNGLSFELGYDGHNGWDYDLPADSPILAVAAGTVLFAGWVDSGCATPAGVVVIQHSNGYRSSYWHLARVDVQAGSQIAQSALIGVVGQTGCSVNYHLHLSIQRLGRDVDPAGWCSNLPDPWAAHPAGASSRWLWLDQVDSCNQPALSSLADDSDPATTTRYGSHWQADAAGNFNGSHWTNSGGQSLWRPWIAQAGRYRVLVFIPNMATNAGTAHYRVAHSDGMSEIVIDQAKHAGSWLSLGEFWFEPGQIGRIGLSAIPGTITWADAVAIQPLQP